MTEFIYAYLGIGALSAVWANILGPLRRGSGEAQGFPSTVRLAGNLVLSAALVPLWPVAVILYINKRVEMSGTRKSGLANATAWLEAEGEGSFSNGQAELANKEGNSWIIIYQARGVDAGLKSWDNLWLMRWIKTDSLDTRELIHFAFKKPKRIIRVAGNDSFTGVSIPNLLYEPKVMPVTRCFSISVEGSCLNQILSMLSDSQQQDCTSLHPLRETELRHALRSKDEDNTAIEIPSEQCISDILQAMSKCGCGWVHVPEYRSFLPGEAIRTKEVNSYGNITEEVFLESGEQEISLLSAELIRVIP